MGLSPRWDLNGRSDTHRSYYGLCQFSSEVLPTMKGQKEEIYGKCHFQEMKTDHPPKGYFSLSLFFGIFKRLWTLLIQMVFLPDKYWLYILKYSLCCSTQEHKVSHRLKGCTSWKIITSRLCVVAALNTTILCASSWTKGLYSQPPNSGIRGYPWKPQNATMHAVLGTPRFAHLNICCASCTSSHYISVCISMCCLSPLNSYMAKPQLLAGLPSPISPALSH